jgi:hypothetical protein
LIARVALVVLCAFAITGTTACKIGRDKGDDPPANGELLESGDSLGAIERLPGGTPVATDVRTLLAADCADGTLTLRTSQEQITSPMDCGQMFPDTIVVRFVGQPVAIRAEDGRLIVENETAGTMNFPAAQPRVKEIDDGSP